MTCECSPAAKAIGVGLVAAAVVFGLFYYTAHVRVAHDDTLTVTGSTKTRVTSDSAKLIISLTRTVPLSELASGYAAIDRDRGLVNALLATNSITTAQKTDSPVSMNQSYDQNTYGAETRYQLTQSITVQSDNVATVTAIAAAVPSLAAQNAIVSVQSLEYYISNLPDLRVALLTDAVTDAKARAEKIAAGTGRSIGTVRTASSGVVQVLAPNSINVDDGGAYDTSSIDKEVMVTVKASFDLR